MGRGAAKHRNSLKKQFVSSASKYIEQLEAELTTMRNDPESAVSQYVNLYQQQLEQNGRLSALVAAIIKQWHPTELRISKDILESFKGERLRIKWKIPEDATSVEDATEYIFEYELEPQQPAPEPESVPESLGTEFEVVPMERSDFSEPVVSVDTDESSLNL